MRYDIAILGSGPAGISAAITATVRNKKVVLFGNRELSEKLRKAHEIQNYPGFPAVSGEELAKAFEAHLAQMNIEITEERVSAVYAMGDYFALQTGEIMQEASAVILATGVNFGKPLPGEKELLGRGVSYCATCDASIYRGKTVAVVGFDKKEEAEADFLSEVCEKVLYFPAYKEEVRVSDRVEVFHEKVTGVEARDGKKYLITDAGEHAADGIFILREAISPEQLVPGLELDGNHAAVNKAMETNLPGVFACGDITGLPYQYVKAAGEGNVAAISAVNYLAKLNNN